LRSQDPGVGIDQDKPARKLVFNVAIVPSTSQLGKAPNLITNQKVTGTDTFTKQKIEYEVSDVTTELPEFEVGAKGDSSGSPLARLRREPCFYT